MTIFPIPEFIKEKEGGYPLPDTVAIHADRSLAPAAEMLSKYLKLFIGLGARRTTEASDVTLRLDPTVEGYTLTVGENGATVTAGDLHSAHCGVSTLAQMISSRVIPYVEIVDKPYTAMRGVHFYMPSRENISSFKRIIDVMSYLKMNTVFLEVGGGMQYDRHPEINEAWERFCDTLINKFPGHGQYRSLQGSDIYWKDSVHTELAGGSYLTKDEVRDLVAYCRTRGMEVIPEIQALSHAYYLTVAHPEIAELKDDPFPDTYCPLDEQSYKLYFDVAEEVLEVFKPKLVSIGHDEIRVLGWCDKCKEKSGHELLTYELTRLHAFYKARGVRIAMWGESLQNFITYTGSQIGGKDIHKKSKFGYDYHMPATDRAIDVIPNDILILDWYHSLGKDSEDCFTVRGFDVIYGNYHGSEFAEWETRSTKPCIRGAEVSSWCPPDEYTFARDGIFFDIAYSAALLWNRTSGTHDAINAEVLRIAPYLRAIMRSDGRECSPAQSVQILYRGEETKAVATIDADTASTHGARVRSVLSQFADKLYGTPINTAGILLRPEVYASSLMFLHSSTEERAFKASHLFESRENWALGAYAVVYEDGTVELASIYYGIEVGALATNGERHRTAAENKGAEIDIDISGEANYSELSPYFTYNHDWYQSLAYNTTPIFDGDITTFAYEWRNPYPKKKIMKIKPINVSKSMTETLVLFGVAAIK